MDTATAKQITLDRYELYDPRDDVKYSYKDQAVMEARAEEIGSTGYSGVSANGQRISFAKVEGEWKAQPSKEADDLNVAEIFKARIEYDAKNPLPTEKYADMKPEMRQAFDEMGVDADSDLEAMATRHLEARYMGYSNLVVAAKQDKLDALPKGDIAARLNEMRQPEPPLTSQALSKQWANIDASDFIKLQQPERQEYAASLLAMNATTNAEYKATLIANFPDVYKQVTALEAVYAEKNSSVSVGAVGQDRTVQIHQHAKNQLQTHLVVLAKDERFAGHSDPELAKVAYFRGAHEKSCALDGKPTNFGGFDSLLADRAVVQSKFPDVEGIENHKIDRGNTRSSASRDDGLSL